jgi:plasmid stabilization system protein ParE
MRVVLTEPALQDLDEIARYQDQHFVASMPSFEARFRAFLERIRLFPNSAQGVEGQPGVRAAVLTPFPYRLFYSVVDDRIEVLHVYHTARDTRPF